MLKSISISPVVRAVFVIGAVAALVTGVTFAALDSSQAALTGNTVSSATAELLVSTDDSTYSDSRPGFDFEGVVPGGDPMPTAGSSFWLRNTGTFDLALTANIPIAPTTVPDTLDLSKVHVVITDPGADGTLDGVDDTIVLQASISELVAGEVSIDGDLAPGDKQFFAQVSMEAETFDGTEGIVNDFDFVFNGTNANEDEETAPAE